MTIFPTIVLTLLIVFTGEYIYKKFRSPKNLLDDFFSDMMKLNIMDRRHVWAILTALRGPDHTDGNMVKSGSTAVVRGKVCHEVAVSVGAASYYPNTRYLPTALRSTSYHFKAHINDASAALLALGYYRDGVV